jgi:hypothetical protein
MAAIGLPTEAYFCNKTAIKLKLKFVLARLKKDFEKNKLKANHAMSFPRGKDINNLLKFIMDARSCRV